MGLYSRYLLLGGMILLNAILMTLLLFDLTHYVPFFTALSGIGNVLLAAVAFWQLPAMESTNKVNQHITRANFLLALTERWMHPDMVTARCLLHQKSLELKKYAPEHLTKGISEYVIEISQNPDPERIRDFSSIISLLEFLETLSCLFEDGHVSIQTLNQLFGGSLERYYHYLKDYIAYRRHHGSPSGFHFQSDESLYSRFEMIMEKEGDQVR